MTVLHKLQGELIRMEHCFSRRQNDNSWMPPFIIVHLFRALLFGNPLKSPTFHGREKNIGMPSVMIAEWLPMHGGGQCVGRWTMHIARDRDFRQKRIHLSFYGEKKITIVFLISTLGMDGISQKLWLHFHKHNCSSNYFKIDQYIICWQLVRYLTRTNASLLVKSNLCRNGDDEFNM